MDKIIKIISTENSRSRRNGLLPFVRYNDTDTTIQYVFQGSKNGNYGHYVCDFAIYDAESNKEITRLKYLDVLSKYNFIQEELRKGVFVKKYTYTSENVVKITDNSENCSDLTSILSNTTEIRWITEFAELSEMSKYDFTPLDYSLFTEKGGYYTYDGPQDNEDILNIIDNSEFCVFIQHYDIVKKYEEEWNQWWEEHFEIGWENKIFGSNYKTHDSKFKFCYEMDTYVLGIIEIIGEYSGSKVPKYLYYTDFFDTKSWFENNSASTVATYNNKTDKNEWVIKEWENRGGGDYYNFLSTITPVWVNKSEEAILSTDGTKKFNYAVPSIDIFANINNETDFETLYTPYEYSLINNVKEWDIPPYSAISSNDIVYIDYAYVVERNKVEYINKYYKKDTLGAGSYIEMDKEYKIITSDSVIANGLTPAFISGMTDMVESKLDSLISPRALQITDKIFGVFQEYDSEHYGYGKLFKCTFKREESSTPYTEVYYSGHTVVTKTFKDSEKVKVEIKNIIKKTHVDDFPEVCPTTTAYQVCSVNKTSTIRDDVVFDTTSVTEEHETDEYTEKTEIKRYYWSAQTYNTYEWWDCEVINDNVSLYRCSDGETVSPGKGGVDNKCYRNVPIVSCIDNLVGKKEVGDYYYVMSRYNNGRINNGGEMNILNGGRIISFSPPYSIDLPLNVVNYDNGAISYDVVTNMTQLDKPYPSLKIEYVLGATSGTSIRNSGIHYEEIIPCTPSNRGILPIDGVYMAEIFYDTLHIDEVLTTVYSSEFKKERTTRIATLTGMEVASVWNEESAVDSFLITKDGTEGLQEEPKYNINLLYNRGNAAAWEKHFKLSECNTMEDLENYGNNFFNI